MSNLDELRAAIDRLDDELLKLLNERAGLAREIGRIKQQNNSGIYDPGRENEIISRLTAANSRGAFPNGHLTSIIKEIMSACRSIQHTDDTVSSPAKAGSAHASAKAPGSVAFLGPLYTFSHEACVQRFGKDIEPKPMGSIREVFEAVEGGKADCGIVPIENSIEGAIGQTLDMLSESGLAISGEFMLHVKLCLMNKSGNESDIKTILSHPQPLGQCRRWLDSKGVGLVEMLSTTIAAGVVADESQSAGNAAIASKLAAEAYNLKIVREDIADNPNNFTRFFVISNETTAPTGKDKTSLLFSVKDEPGALFKILQPFADAGINLTKIESRPSRKKAWDYLFFVDLLGHINDKKVKGAVDELEKSCVFLKVLGSYPAAKGV